MEDILLWRFGWSKIEENVWDVTEEFSRFFVLLSIPLVNKSIGVVLESVSIFRERNVDDLSNSNWVRDSVLPVNENRVNLIGKV